MFFDMLADPNKRRACWLVSSSGPRIIIVNFNVRAICFIFMVVNIIIINIIIISIVII